MLKVRGSSHSSTEPKMKSFKIPRATIWTKVDGSIACGMLTNNLDLVPVEVRPKSHPKLKKGYKRLFCLNRRHMKTKESQRVEIT